ncbi:hypothetical protein ACVWXS_004699 [Lysinibacillus sp. TE18511]
MSSILEKLNERFGTQFTEIDFLSREQVKDDMLNDEELRQKAPTTQKKTSNSLSKKHSWTSLSTV